jgi:hypothetical protein
MQATAKSPATAEKSFVVTRATLRLDRCGEAKERSAMVDLQDLDPETIARLTQRRRRRSQKRR